MNSVVSVVITKASLLFEIRFLMAGALLLVIGTILLSRRNESHPGGWQATAGLLFGTFAVWAFYWHLSSFAKPDWLSLLLGFAPVGVLLLYSIRATIGKHIDRIGKVKLRDFEVEFENAARKVQEESLLPIVLDETVFSRKRSVADLHREVTSAIKRLAWLPPTKRTLYIQVDLRHSHEGPGIDAAALYFYLLVLREATSQVQARLAGVLFYETQTAGIRVQGIVETADYITAFERRYPSARRNISLSEVENLIDLALTQSSQPYINLFEQLLVGMEYETAIQHFMPNLVPYLHKVEFVSRHEFSGVPKKLSELLVRQTDYLAVLEGHTIIAIVPVLTLSAEVATSITAVPTSPGGSR